MEKPRVLCVIQLPKECGGSYTTGVARVGEGLYKELLDDFELYWYFTNVKQEKASSFNSDGNHYYGYQIPPLQMLKNVILHPVDTMKQWFYYKKINATNPLRFEFYKANFIRVIKTVKPQLIHMHSDGVAPLYYANQYFHIPILLTFHGIMYEPATGVWEQNRNDVLGSIKMSNYYTALNYDVKRKAISLGVNENKLWIVPNGTNSNKFYYSQEKRELIRKKFSVSADTVIFITTGVVIDRKGQFDFLKLLEQIGIDYQYWIIGKGPDEVKIMKYAEYNGITEKVKLLGYIESGELYEYLSAADIYAHVSTTEGQAMAEIEAFATGLPTIVRKMIANTVIGDPFDKKHYYIVDLEKPPKNNKELVEWIHNIKNENRQSNKGCDWSFVAKQYGEVYRKILIDL